jgi:hypothetical protein
MESTANGIAKRNGYESPAIPMTPIESLEQFTFRLEQFLLRLNAEPDQADIQVNRAANNSQYKPISFVQNDLDELFAGLWNFEIKSYQVIANEIVGTGLLEVFHPIARMWIKRSGAAAVMIQQKSEKNGGTGRISNIDDKIKNTLVKDFPHLESELIKSAAKKLGKVFGRDLNREHEGSYSPVYTEEAMNNEGLTQAIEALKIASKEEEFKQIWAKYPNLQSNAEFQKNYQYYLRINTKRKP